MSETTGTETAVEAEEQLPYLCGVRLRVPLQAEDHVTDQEDLAVGDFVVVETGQGTAVGEIRRPKRPLPEFKRGRLYRQVLRRATDAEVAEWRERRAREVQGVLTCHSCFSLGTEYRCLNISNLLLNSFPLTFPKTKFSC